MACALIPSGRAGTRTRTRRNSQPCSSSGRTTSRVAKTTCACRTYGSTAFCATTIRSENCTPSCLAFGLRWHLLRPQSESAKFTAFYAFPLVETVELLVCTRLLPPCWQWPHSPNCSAGVSAPAVACRRHKTVCCPAGNRAECAASGSSFGLPAGLRGLSPSWDSPIGRARRGSVGVSRSKVFRPANPGLRGQRCLQVYRAAAMPRRPPVCRRI